eukprot:6181686-Pleurochrysis_carterae.AAC.2
MRALHEANMCRGRELSSLRFEVHTACSSAYGHLVRLSLILGCGASAVSASGASLGGAARARRPVREACATGQQ